MTDWQRMLSICAQAYHAVEISMRGIYLRAILGCEEGRTEQKVRLRRDAAQS